MKKKFSQMCQCLLANANRLLIVCAVIMSANASYAFDWEGKAQLTVHGQTGKGKVYIEESSNGAPVSTPTDNVAWTYDYQNAGTDKNVNNETPSAYFAIHAKADTRHYFEGWYRDEACTSSYGITAKDYNATVTANSSSGQHDHYYANFARIISGIKTEKILVWYEGSTLVSSRAKVVVPVHAAQDGDIMTIDITGSGDLYLSSNDIKLYNELGDDITETKQVFRSSDGTFVFSVGYIGTTITDIEKLLQKKIGLHVVANGNPNDRDWEDFEVFLEEAPTLTFKGTNRKGTYSSNILSNFDTNSTDSKVINITSASMLKGVTLNLLTDPTDGDIFFGWKVTKLDGTETLISYAEECTAPEFEGGETIEAVFVPNTCGYIIMNGNAGSMSVSNNNVYADLHLALVDAETIYKSTNKAQFIILDNLYTILSNKGVARTKGEKPSSADTATLPNREGGYIIPEGITFLIPADNAYNYFLEDEDMPKGYYGSGRTFKAYRKLIVEEGTYIKVNGNICVFALLNYNNASAGSHGIIELNDGAHIEVNGRLHVYGYIINPSTTTITDENMTSVGKVTANSSATVVEVLQMTDWRGGTAASGMLYGNIFPINQYYVQNIEVPITFLSGSREYLTTAVDVTLFGTMVASPLFVKPKTDTKNPGFFEIGDGATFTKYYDVNSDRLKCIAKGDLNATNPTASVSNMALKLNFEIDSKNFVLPITNNIDIRVTNLTLDMPYDICILAGATVTIDENAKVLLGNEKEKKVSSCFIYDVEWNTQNGIGTGAGYFGQSNLSILRLANRPGGFKTPRRTIDNDATMIVNGLAEVGSYGAVYTTAKGSEGYSYGANITSTDRGRIKFLNIGDKTTTQQVTQSNTSTNSFDIPVSSAYLKNADGTYVQTTIEDKGKSYVYIDGVWQVPTWVLPTITITLPTQKFAGEVDYPITDYDKNDSWRATLSGGGFTFDGASTTFNVTHNDDMGNNITLPIHYSAQNINGVHTATLTLENITKDETYTTELEATENYTPRFTLSPSEVTMPLTYVGAEREILASPITFQINPINDNVTSLLNNGESDLYKGVTLRGESDNDQFVFIPGGGRELFAGAKIIFKPTTTDSQTAHIKLIVTYTDGKPAEVFQEDEVILVVNAQAAEVSDNQFVLTEECRAALADMCVSVPVPLEFDNLTDNTNPLEILFENNGDESNPILSYTGTGTEKDPFVVTANLQPSTMPTIYVKQDVDYNTGYAAWQTSCQTDIKNCYPDVQWHWSDLYFGGSYNTPLTTNSTGAYTLSLQSIKKNSTSVTPSSVMTYDANAGTAVVKSNLSGEYIATFQFSQQAGESHVAYTTTFTSRIYVNPGQLPLCVSNERIFNAINHSHEGEVSYTNTIDIASEASWIMTFIGVPDILRFTTTSNTQLLVEEGEFVGSLGTAFYGPVEADKEYEVELKPATKYVKFKVIGDATSISSLCINKLDRVRITPDILYMPISNDPINKPTKRTITVTYASTKDMVMHSSTNEISLTPTTLEKTANDEYKVVNVTVSSAATSEYDASLYVEHEVGGQAEVDIETYHFPQKLPIQLEKGKDPAKRFYFVTDVYKNTEWDAAQYAVKMQNKTTTEAERPFVTFAFDGAPSFISFVPVVATSTTDWLIKEGVDATSLNPVKVEATMENGELKQTLDYTSRYVHVTYVGTSAEVVQMTKVNILSDQSAIPNPEELELTDANKYVGDVTVGKDLNLTVVNLTNLSVAIDNEHFTLSYGSETPATTFALDADAIDGVFGEDVVGAIPFKVFWDASQATDFGNITFTTEVDGAIKTLATVPLVGTKAGLTEEEIIYTGVKNGYILDGKFEGIYGLKDEVEKSTEHRKVDLSSTYDQSGKPLFDYLIIYGETTTTDGTTTITTPTTTAGSNAKTPMYIYYKDGDAYKFWTMEENVNTATKAISSLPVAKGQQLRIYITGFCPYATTGYTKEDEGVWYFQGVNDAKLDIYLEDCYIYSRHKTLEGRAFSGRYDGQAFSEGYVRGSGGVLVFENQDNDQGGSFDVTIHTRRNNMFKSNYGCFFELMQGMRAYNVSSPIQVHLASDKHKANSKTTLTFDDKWPNDATNYDAFDRTNGYLSLQKQVNNAPSIDLGNANTIVNFRGGQVELQNAAVVSPNYKTTFAISFRSGLMAGFPMAYGIGTDDVGGTVNFYDGTTTVIPMVVDVKYRDYYLMDTDANGNELTTTSCLRTPTNTFVYGGSHCMMRACEDVTSKGGAPTKNGNPLGIYIYPKIKATVEAGQTAPRGGFGEPNGVGLVNPTDIPAGYQAESVTPNTNGTADTSDDYLNFWFTTEEESSVKPEVDKKINFWKACMTEISAEYMSYGGTVGGETMILPNEENKYLLYCQIDENISNVISAGTGFGEDRVYSYKAPVKDPSGQLGQDYLYIPPSYVGEEYQNYIETVDKDDKDAIVTGQDYTVSEKVYYVVPTTADTWMTFTAPFNVEKLYIVEAYEEAKLAATPLKEVADEDGNTITLNKRQSVLLEQAKHNADFAAFFGVTMALGRDKTFEEIHRDYEGWALYVDKKEKTRGKIELKHYNGKNFMTANYYLYHNAGEWTRNGDKFDTQWEVVGEVADGGILMHQGETYSMLFPYCTGCDVLKDAEGKIIYDANGLPQLSGVRDYWDYWSGKFLIFESTQATSNDPHTIKGSNYHEQLFAPATSGNGSAAVLTGNSTFALMTSNDYVDGKVYTYSALMGRENFKNNTIDDGYGNMLYQQIQPTVSFLIADIPSKAGMPARNVMRSGEIIYGKENTSTDVNQGGNIPTVGGGNDLFITAAVAGVNIAVAEPQQVRVMSATGAIIYSGMVQTAVDVALPTTGVYVITGENEVHKILH